MSAVKRQPAKPLPVSPHFLTMQIVYAAGQDAGNRSMRKAGRSKWNRADFNAAAEEFARLAPHAVDISPAMKAALSIAKKHGRRVEGAS